MKFKGKKIEGKNIELVVIPRPGENIAFFCEAVQNHDEFNELCPQPKPPKVTYPGGIIKENTEDPVYQKNLDDWATLRTNYTIIKSLQNNPDIEWELVDFKKPSTWGDYQKELKEAGFTEIEVYRIIQGVLRANSLDEDMLKEAKKAFLQDRSLQDVK